MNKTIVFFIMLFLYAVVLMVLYAIFYWFSSAPSMGLGEFVLGGILMISLLQLWIIAPAMLLYWWVFEENIELLRALSGTVRTVLKYEYIMVASVICSSVFYSGEGRSEMLTTIPFYFIAGVILLMVYERYFKESKTS